ncbi:MAG: glycosyltransferase family 1 protein [Sphingobacteriales bacterium]|nr:MAG: glycosyltransferase family 1 protein [Sphingobacteriales bacterium]
MKMRLLQSNDDEYFLDCIDELYRTIESDGADFNIERIFIRHSRFKSFLIRKLILFPGLFKLRPKLSNLPVINFVSMISGDFRLLLPYAFSSSLNFIYMYDVWPRFHNWIFPLLDFFSIKYVFFSSKQVLEIYQEKYSHVKCKALWVPEALVAGDYHYTEYSNRKIDVLEFGRMYDAYHELIKEPLASNGKKHIFRTPDKYFLFADKQSFTTALASSKIVICVPSNITNPERSEFISSMTLRYLQAMASKCLIVGLLPSDMEEVFGYNPIVEIDMENPGQQLLDILDNYERYLPLIEKNYREVLAKHQWINRWEIMKTKITEVI